MAAASATTTVTYPITLKTPAYCINVSFGMKTTEANSCAPYAVNSSTTGFTYYYGQWQKFAPQVTHFWSCIGV